MCTLLYFTFTLPLIVQQPAISRRLLRPRYAPTRCSHINVRCQIHDAANCCSGKWCRGSCSRHSRGVWTEKEWNRIRVNFNCSAYSSLASHSPAGKESVSKIIINVHKKLIFKLQSAFWVISNHNSFRVLFDKIAYVYLIWKRYLYFSVGNGQPREPALCQLYRHTCVLCVLRKFQ